MLRETMRLMRGTYRLVTRLDWPVVSHWVTPWVPYCHFHPPLQGSLPAVPFVLQVLNPGFEPLFGQLAPPVAKYRSHRAFTSPGAVGGAAAAPSSSSSSRARRRAIVLPGEAAGLKAVKALANQGKAVKAIVEI